MENENLQTENVPPTPRRGFCGRISRKTRWGIAGAALLAVTATGAMLVNQVVPKPWNGAQSFSDRLAWYVHQGQLRADLHTLASAIEFVVTSDADLPSDTVSVSPPVAKKENPTPPKS